LTSTDHKTIWSLYI